MEFQQNSDNSDNSNNTDKQLDVCFEHTTDSHTNNTESNSKIINEKESIPTNTNQVLNENTNTSSNLNSNQTEEKVDKTESQDPKIKRFNTDNYITLMSIGQGNFSEVFMVEHIETKVLYSLKMFTKKRVEMLKKQEDVLMEKHVMEKIDEQENIIKYYGSNKDEVIFIYNLPI